MYRAPLVRRRAAAPCARNCLASRLTPLAAAVAASLAAQVEPMVSKLSSLLQLMRSGNSPALQSVDVTKVGSPVYSLVVGSADA